MPAVSEVTINPTVSMNRQASIPAVRLDVRSVAARLGFASGRSIPARFQPKRQMAEETIPMKAIVVTDQAAGTAGMKLVERPEPQGARASWRATGGVFVPRSYQSHNETA